MAAQWPLVVNRLVALLPTLPGWSAVEVFDGAAFDVDTDVSVFCTVGHYTDGMTTTAGNFSTADSPDGFQIIESGGVACQLTYNADAPGDMTAVRGSVFTLFDQLDASLRADRRLAGVLSPDSAVSLAVDVKSTQYTSGAGMTVGFTVSYQTTT